MEDYKKQEITTLAATVQKATEQITAYENGAPAIEIDILKENLRKLYTWIDGIEINNQPNSEETESSKISKEPELPKVTEEETTEKVADKAEEFKPVSKLFITPESEEVNEENTENQVISKEIKEEEDNVVEITKEPEVIKEEEPIKQPKVEKENKEVVQKKEESVAKETKSVHELAAEKSTEKTIGENIRSNSIDNLKKHIGINDKFQFINELFDGKMKIYNEAIETLDKMSEIKAAYDFLKPIQKTYVWNVESPVYEQFMGYIMRRFS